VWLYLLLLGGGSGHKVPALTLNARYFNKSQYASMRRQILWLLLEFAWYDTSFVINIDVAMEAIIWPAFFWTILNFHVSVKNEN